MLQQEISLRVWVYTTICLQRDPSLIQSWKYLTSLTILCDLLTLAGFLLYQHTTFPNNFEIRCTLKFMSLTTSLVVMIVAMVQSPVPF